MAKLLAEISLIHRHILPQRIEVGLYKFFSEFLRIIGFSLPNKRSDIVINRTLSAALEIDKIRFTIYQHHVTRLEITIEESSGSTTHKNIAHTLKIILEFYFGEIETGSFQKAIFEVIQVERNHSLVEFRLRIADREVQAIGAKELYFRQFSHSFTQQFTLLLGERAASTPFFRSFKQNFIA